MSQGWHWECADDYLGNYVLVGPSGETRAETYSADEQTWTVIFAPETGHSSEVYTGRTLSEMKEEMEALLIPELERLAMAK